MVLAILAMVGLGAYPLVILADMFGKGPDAQRRMVLAERGMTDDGVPWMAGKTSA